MKTFGKKILGGFLGVAILLGAAFSASAQPYRSYGYYDRWGHFHRYVYYSPGWRWHHHRNWDEWHSRYHHRDWDGRWHRG